MTEMVQNLEKQYKMAFEKSTEVSALLILLKDLVERERDWQRYEIDIDQMIESNCTKRKRRSKFHRIKEAFAKCTLVIEHELDFLANIGSFVLGCALKAPRRPQGAARSSQVSVIKANSYHTETEVEGDV